MTRDRIEDLDPGDLATAQRILAGLATGRYASDDLRPFLDAWQVAEERLERWQGDVLGAYLVTLHADCVVTAIAHGHLEHAPFLRHLKRRHRNADWWHADIMEPPRALGG